MMKEFDVFGEQKEKSFTDSVYPTEIVMMHLLETQQKIKENEELIPEAFKLFLKVCIIKHLLFIFRVTNTGTYFLCCLKFNIA